MADESLPTEPLPTEPLPTPRRHDLDALRAFAMLLGIALHAGLSFAPFPWLVQDSQQSVLFFLFFALIHGFRMPLFFLLSGFFTVMLWRRRGVGATVEHRARRILLPCLLGLVTILPLTTLSYRYAIDAQANAPAPTVEKDGSSLLAAVRTGDAESVSRWLEEGADPNERDGLMKVPALAWAAFRGDVETTRLLLDAGADANGRNEDDGTALHGAALFGRDEVIALLLERGADANATSMRGDTPLQASQAEWETTRFLAGFLKVPLGSEEEVAAGRERAASLLAAAEGGSDPRPEAANGDEAPATLRERYHAWLNSDSLRIRALATPPDSLAGLVLMDSADGLHLVNSNVFSHLWFLWFLCWLTPMFAVYAAVADRVGWRGPPRWLVVSPARWLWILPPALALQWLMREPSLGPDTSIGLLPAPHLLAYYALFYFFGALYYDCDDAEGRLGKWWAVTLPVCLVVLAPMAMVGGEWPVARALCEVLYAWGMSFALMGLCRRVLRKERPAVRYVSDSSYWLYLAHLPLVIVAQVLVRDWQAPSGVKFALLTAAVTLVLLVSYQTLVRYTWVGRLLNGPRKRRAERTPLPASA